jgi:adhesin/invasin
MDIVFLSTHMVLQASRRLVLRTAPSVAALGALSLLFAALSCQKTPLVAPSGTAITLVASTNVLPANGSADITAVLVQGAQSSSTGAGGGTTGTVTAGVGVPVHNGTLVTFTTTLGSIEPAEARTEAGKAVVKLNANGQSGTAVITAFSGAATQTLNVLIGSAGAARILVTADPQSLPADGGTARVLATVQDQEGNGLQGVPVTFSTTAGTLSSTSALSDASGLATTTLSTTAAATVTASSGGTTGTLSGTVAITLLPRTTIDITAPASAVVSTTATFTLTVGANTTVTDVTVDFGDGEVQSYDTVSSTRTVQHLYGAADTYTVTATATDSLGRRTSATTTLAVAPLNVSASANATSVPQGSPVVITVTVTSGAQIDHYTWDFGQGDPFDTNGNSQSLIYDTKGTKLVTITVHPVKGKAITVFVSVEIT